MKLRLSKLTDQEKRGNLPDSISAINDANEKRLISRLESGLSEVDDVATLWELACHYRRTGRNGLGVAAFQEILNRTQDTEVLASCYLTLGQIAEQEQDYQAALDHYSQGLALKPDDKQVGYFLHNNTGYCLNLFGKHAEAERHCRRAIEIDSQRNNAYKNLGIALQGQGKLVDAAWAYIEAAKADGNPRTLPLLADLLTSYPEIISQFHGILTELAACKRAVEKTLPDGGRELGDAQEICKLKYVPGRGLFELVGNVRRKISPEEIDRLYTEEALRLVRNNPGIWCAILREHDPTASSTKGSAGSEKGHNPHSGDNVLNWLRSVTPCLVLSSASVNLNGE
ncbi:MAG TPA: tetratricopeptide repeat protein [Candidatus Eisenbacteria bacterium]|nr:tetratricopeptide repeat protein [Candidatus Eisenbacteria bacterium]